ncbi:MAG: nucleotide exchange factor GrpE [Cyclobacteriaceae bacterium]|jgi:molecular chaperone GrpE|uniref:Protein GrpE n=1 Tax=Algoriphagus marincola TaxID=264027 RepID=A0ABS7N715_9BACT|nr:nucleotide exchange factor GrpE [Algoriphagus marincola]MBY5952124.1 nucleotide exchange factor GrpE [Algoriphagus marincola]MCR9081574.1 nucleotide exchange factor GrpE [Cyclobacteriaceae bacterium]
MKKNKEEVSEQANEEVLDQKEQMQNDKEVAQEEPVKEPESNLDPLAKMQGELAEMKDKYLRLYSDFENFRKRNAKERLDLIKTASEEVLRDLIPVVDDFERAFKASENESDAGKVREGNHLIFQKFVKVLESKGLKVMEDQIGHPFDAETQEAITQIPAPSEEMKGKVIDVVEKGYTLGDKVVRYAKVVTGA